MKEKRERNIKDEEREREASLTDEKREKSRKYNKMEIVCFVSTVPLFSSGITASSAHLCRTHTSLLYSFRSFIFPRQSRARCRSPCPRETRIYFSFFKIVLRTR